MIPKGGAATQIYSQKFDHRFFALPEGIQRRIQKRIDGVGLNLSSLQHQRLQGVTAFKLRVGDHRIVYEFDAERHELYLITVGNRRDIYKKAIN